MKIACIKCGKLRQGRAGTLCKACWKAGRSDGLTTNPHWKGGRFLGTLGYIHILLTSHDFFYSMATKATKKGGNAYVREHRLVMAKHLGRCLQSWEIVHHKNGIKTDNRIENLQLIHDIGHRQLTALESRIALLEQRVHLLEAENALLRGQLNESRV